jgi:CubicO group peptidase (beta-lactamase class C family)
MRAVLWITVACGWLSFAGSASADTPIPSGTWAFNAGGWEGALFIKVAEDGKKVTGLVYGNPITGIYDPASARLSFTRVTDPMDRVKDQTHVGYLFSNEVTENGERFTRYTIAGTVSSKFNNWDSGWFAQTTVGNRPVSGKGVPGVQALDALMKSYMQQIGCSAAVLAVSYGNTIHVSRGYGWSDREHKVHMAPNTPIGIGSCGKTFTASAIRQLSRNGKLDLNASVFELLNVRPQGTVIDNRIWNITVNHLLDHKAGWQGEPLEKAWKAYNGAVYPVEVEKALPYVMVQKLAWTPGEKSEYDSFGYNTLARIVAHVAGDGSGKSYVDYLRNDLCRPYGIKELHWIAHGPRQPSEPPRLWNAMILEDPEDWRWCASAPACCAFMSHFWSNGEPRGKNPQSMAFYGSWDNTTAAMLWRGDGVNIVYSFNGRGSDEQTQTDFEHSLHLAVERMHFEKK